MDSRGRDNRKVNVTKQNILRKRREMARRRRRAILRLILLIIFVILVLTGIVAVGYGLVTVGSMVNREYQTMYDGYTTRQQLRRGNVDPKFDGYTNVLIMGIDDGLDSDGGDEKRADAIMVASLENETGKLRLIHIPRDTWINEISTGQQMKIKNLYALGGAPLMVRQINNVLGISIHQYAVLDMNVFSELIDVLGGVDIYVESDMNYDDQEAGISIHLPMGYQHLDGKQAQQYLRYRSEDLGDEGRVQRQQRFCKALYQNLLQVRTVAKLPEIAEICKKRVDYSAEIFDSMHLANVLRRLNSDTPVSVILPGEPAADDQTIWVMDDLAAAERMKELFPTEGLDKQ